jgi:hypothetical protein
LIAAYVEEEKADMKDRPEIPKFASEEEEANWWFENRARVEEEFVEAARAGRLRSGSTVLSRARSAAWPG